MLHIYDESFKTMFGSYILPFVLQGSSFRYVNCIYLRILVSVQHYFHFRLCLCRLIVSRQMEQELLTLPKHHLGSLLITVGFAFLVFSFLCSMLQIIFSPFVLFLIAIILSVLRLTACDYLFGIFKLIFTNPITIYSIENEKSITTQKTCNQTNNSNPKTPVKDRVIQKVQILSTKFLSVV